MPWSTITPIIMAFALPPIMGGAAAFLDTQLRAATVRCRPRSVQPARSLDGNVVAAERRRVARSLSPP